MSTVIKTPTDDIKYSVDWSGLLGSDTIATSAWSVTGLTVSNETNTTTVATAQFSGGSDRTVYEVISTVTTTQGQILNTTFFISVEARI